jgi:hypothetical protein
MAISNLQHVQPGDLITAKSMNDLVDALLLLEQRVSDIEAGGTPGGPPILMERSPTGDVEVNSLLTLKGRNFLRPSELNTVMLGEVPINRFADNSDDRNLVFTIPDVFSSLPRSVPIFIHHEFGDSTSMEIRLLPRTPTQGGQVIVFNQTPPLPEINVGSSYNFSWLVDSQTILPARYRFSVVFTNVIGASLTLWQEGTEITPSGPREITAGHPLTVNARVTVPTGATSVDIALKVEATDRFTSRTSDSISLVVGRPPVLSDPRALLTIAEIPPFDPNTGDPNTLRSAQIDGVDGIEVQFGQTGQIPINIHVTDDGTAEGTYTYSALIEDGARLWNAGPIVPVTNALRAPDDATISVQIQNTDTRNTSDIKFLIVKAAHRPVRAAADDFTSFIRFPIRGYTP